MKFINIAAALLAGSACMAPALAQADDLQGVWFLGGTVDTGQSGYAGGVVALPGNHIGSGLAVRVTGTAGNYDYTTRGQTIDGTYTGGEIALVYQTSGKWGWANFSVGPRVTDTRLHPFDPANGRVGTKFDAGLQSDGALDGHSWRASWLTSYAPVVRAYQIQARLAYKLGNGHYRLGVEGGVLGDPSFNKENAGLHAALPFIGRSELQIGGGATFQQGRNGRPYGSLGISSVF